MSPTSPGLIDSKAIRGLIWTYFILLMFEGVLRKWIFPGFSNQLLLVRDPVLLLIYVFAIVQGAFIVNTYVLALAGLGAIAVLTGMTVGTNDILVTLYGFDACFFHLPFIFIIPRVLEQKHVLQIGKWVLFFSIPMAFLMTLQFRSSPEAWINCGAGGGLGAQIRGAMGKIRPPGYFTFITGAAQFLAFATVFVLYGFINRQTYSKVLLYLAAFAVVISAVVSTSRLALGSIGSVFLMIGFIVLYSRQSLPRIGQLLLPIAFVLLLATNLDIFKEGRVVFEARLLEAGDAGAGISGTTSNWTQRVFSDFILGMEALPMAETFGQGLGLGTNVGARLMSGRMGFLLAEGEWARIILELGPLIGGLYLIIRVCLCLLVFHTAINSARNQNILPILLFGSCALLLLTGQFSQATTLGFTVLLAGLCLASANVVSGEKYAHVLNEKRKGNHGKQRGIAIHAAELHFREPGQTSNS